MNGRYWDWGTYFLYIVLCYLIYCLLYYVIKNSSVVLKRFGVKVRFSSRAMLAYSILLIVMILFTAYREVSGLIGGADALAYIDYFLDRKIVNVSIYNIIKLKQEEPLFYLVGLLIRFFTDEYVVYFSIIYTFICTSFSFFIIKHSNKNDILVPLIYLIVPILGSFNTIRSWFAVAIVLFAFSALVDDNFMGFLFFCVLAFLTHFTSIVVIVFYSLGYWIIRLKRRNKINRNILGIIILLLFLTIIVGEKVFRGILANTKYQSYGEYTNSIIGQFTTITLGILVLKNYENLSKKMGSNYEYFIYFVLLNFAFTPFVVLFGFWRMIDYFIFPRLIVWSNILKIYEVKYFSHSVPSKLFYRLLIFIIFSIWTFFRVYKMWYSSGIMPYRTILL